MIKIVFFDVDGTLVVTGETTLSPKTAEALRALRRRGILICMATGRSNAAIPRFPGVTFDLVMTFNGAYAAASDAVILRAPMDHDDALRVLRNLKDMDRAAAIATEDCLVANGSDEDLAGYFEVGSVDLIIADDFEELCRGDIYQILCACRPNEYERILAGTRNSRMAVSWDRAVDIIPADGGKGRGVRAVLEHYGFEKNEAAAFGDSGNDIEMLEAVGTGVAMGNAKPEVKAAADEVCGSVEEDGIYHWCRLHGLI